MTMMVLQNKQQISDARRVLVERNLSYLEAPLVSKVKSIAKRFGLEPMPTVGDDVKSWDVLTTLQFLERQLPKDAPVLDIGCYASEIIVALHNAGFTDLTGIDLNSKLGRMPYADKINYRSGNFMHTELPDASFQAVTSISVIEHGLDAPLLMAELGRIIRPGGYFIASFDYWPDKIDTKNTAFFGLSWLIFGREDVQMLLDEAAKNGLHPVGELHYDGGERAIEHGGYHYTFAWLALQKRA